MRKWLKQVFGGAAAVFAAAVCLSTASCEKYILPRLECDIDTIWAPVEGGLYEVTISSNVKWMFDIMTIGKWITIDVQEGSSDYADAEYPLKVQVKANDTGAERECVMNYTSTTLSRYLVVEQEGPADSGEGGEDESSAEE